MLCGFGTEFVGGRLPFVLHPAVLPKLQSIAQRLGLPTPTSVEPPASVAAALAAGPAPSSQQQLLPSLMGIEPILLSAMLSTLQQSAMPLDPQQPPQVNPAAKALFTLLMQQQAIRNNLLPSLSLVDAVNNNSTSPTMQPGVETVAMDFSPVVSPDEQTTAAIKFVQGTSNGGSSEASPADLTTTRASNKLTPATTSSSFMAPSSSSSPVDAEIVGKNNGNRHNRTPHRRGINAANFANGDNPAGLIVHGEPIECLPAYAKLANSRWSHKLQRQQQQQQCANNNNNNSSLNNSDDMTVGPSPNNNACSPTSACMHVCIFCGKRYSRKYGLKIHLRTHTGYRPLECRYCHRRFGDPSNLNKHLRLHAQVESPFVCKFCGKSLVRRRDLDRHLRSRHPNMIATAAQPTGGNDATSPSTTPAATLMTPVSTSTTTPSSRSHPQQQQQQQQQRNSTRLHQPTFMAGNTMVFPSRGASPSSSSSPTAAIGHSQ